MRPYFCDEWVTLYHARCEDVLPHLDVSFDAVICDPPYGTTACAWDTPIDFGFMWRELKRLTRRNAAIVLFGSQPFTSALVMSNPSMFRYEWIWRKQKPTGFLDARRKPLKAHESIVVFADGRAPYSPQGLQAVSVMSGRKNKAARGVYGIVSASDYIQTEGNFPQSVLDFDTETSGSHPSQKPLALLEYLILTYTNPGDTVLDFAAGSGTTAVAAKKLGRKCVAVEMELEYCAIAATRLAQGVFDLEMTT